MKRKSISRRSFLKKAGVSMAAVPVIPLIHPVQSFAKTDRIVALPPGNKWPGRGILDFNEDAFSSGLIQIVKVKEMVDESIKKLTGQDSVALAWESIFPDSNPITIDKKIAIKVNVTFTTKTHWQVVKAVTDGLMSMLGGTYPGANISLFDVGGWGVTWSRALFPGVIQNDSSTDAGHYDSAAGCNMANCMYDAAYLINIPVIKTHWASVGGITLGFKNHVGSFSDVSCKDVNGLVNGRCAGVIKQKTVLTVIDAIKGTKGGYNGSETTFPTYAAHMRSPASTQVDPCTIIMSTDMVVADYLGRKVFRVELNNPQYGSGQYDLIQAAANTQYGIGAEDDPAWDYREIINGVPSVSTEQEKFQLHGGIELMQNTPNPMSYNTSIRYSIPENLRSRPAYFTIYDLQGRIIKKERLYSGASHIAWDGLDMSGNMVHSGVYLYRISVNGASIVKKLIVRR
ncbi:MAG: hypothetical protein A2487_11865 [Candidatus Raymondbacteria bacterium RifOxyC12_full_50_8]|uniref:DUF362 domain-containing protein n=1 Tax=Candidatus Raymondbacteria bacterium RIFOXYD12_FULL_49_13 TaxID=1817890 RepID=A0A1F7F6R8_UNCRA|nr:MAG: hypothetical protein A2248_13065 [Candidatus Raymondbacteria bacterium RIFOXYA2_FULL_49_16]OGJ95731.1 MAG: hypothetical protein A2487_11865 [Candidatus Raymondbacteria bacterium RifOxyC12_full_50_8]OGJ96029.1 MAG: hypothetical protein A2350_04505 [Candidatus Raymondbacteria bacterium RifOxyB12_full_50_8]OGK02217.1 MAG: hypothetical protein A2519_16180 [Candidatus Raymondbacteria bacterium RIFOXYD12_FULL_49_13]OGP45170.1 MAG: hypothetical protein A2324_12290 [Candidatus Raymondbacteria b